MSESGCLVLNHKGANRRQTVLSTGSQAPLPCPSLVSAISSMSISQATVLLFIRTMAESCCDLDFFKCGRFPGVCLQIVLSIDVLRLDPQI